MRVMIALGAAAVAVAACAPPPTPAVRTVTLTERFDPADFAWAQAEGANTITGSVLMRTVGGDVKTCGGLEVELIPDAPYSRERIAATYYNASAGYRAANSPQIGPVIMGPVPAGYDGIIRRTVCGPEGRFRFSGLPDGGYFVIGEVTWGAPTAYGIETQGGWIMRRIEVSGGQTAEVILTHSGK